MTPTSTRRQGIRDTHGAASRCFYAADPIARPHCQLTATIGYGNIRLCPSCQAMRSTVGKGQTATPLRTPQVNVLDWLSDALADLHTAEQHLTAAVTRARQQGHSWALIGQRLGTTRQAAQQRFALKHPPTSRS